MAAAVVGDAAVTSFCQEEHLVFPRICAERPTVTEDHWLSLAPILVVDLRPVLGRKAGQTPIPRRMLFKDPKGLLASGIFKRQ
jgi:hypothetical protein